MTRASLWTAGGWGLLVVSSLKNVANPDIFWHLSAGRRILDERRLPAEDWLSFTKLGRPWSDFEWLSQACFAVLHGLAGFWGLIALKLALVLGSAAVIDGSLRRRGADERARGAALIALAAAWAIHNDIRPDWLSILLFCVELSALEAMRRGEWSRGPLPTAAAAAAVGALWANAHAGFPAGLAVGAVYAVAVPAARPLVLGLAAGTLLNPLGPGVYGVIAEHAKDAGLMGEHINEWKWATPRNRLTWPAWALAAFCLARMIKRRPAGTEAASWAALAGLAFMAALQLRHIPFFAAGAVLVAWPQAVPPRAAAAVLLAAGLFLPQAPQDLSRSGLRAGKFPEGAAAYLQSHPETAALKLHHPWHWGGFLAWRLPGYKVYFDGRYLFHDLLARSMSATSDPRSWNAFLDAEGLDGALLPKDQPDMKVVWEENGAERQAVVPYQVLFMPRERWTPVFEDELSVLFVRKR